MFRQELLVPYWLPRVWSYSPCPTMSENDAIPSTVMNHKNRSHDAGILLAASLSRNLSCRSKEPLIQSAGILIDSFRQDHTTYAFCNSVKLCRKVCRLSRFSFEKHTRAGISMVKNVKAIQKATSASKAMLSISYIYIYIYIWHRRA